MNCNTTHYRANSSSVPGDPTGTFQRRNPLPALPAPGPESRSSLDNHLAAVHPDDVEAVHKSLQDVLSGRQAQYEAVYRLPGACAGWVWVLDRGKVSEQAATGGPRRIVGTLRNIDSIMQTEQRLSLVAAALQQSHDGAIIVDREFRLAFANDSAARYLRKPVAELLGSPIDARDIRFGEDAPRGDRLARFARSMETGTSAEGELVLALADGTQVPVAVTLSPIRDRHGAVTHCVAFLADITFRKQAENDLLRLARFDALTGLPNRSLLMDRLGHGIAQARRAGTRLALLFVDLDNFKHVNDSLGHAAGDELLRQVSARMSAAMRDADTVARLGGDEFTVLLEQAADESSAVTVAQKLIEALAREFIIVGQRVRVSPSIGIALCPEHGSEAAELLKNADIAMYHAKSEGRNNFQFYRPELNARVLARIQLEEKLRAALAADGLELHYQPKVCVQTGRVLGLEALLRWRDAEDGVIAPSVFIPVAEESGLIIELGQWVLRKACTQTAAWLALGLDPGCVAVNLSARQFRDRDLIVGVQAALREAGLEPGRLELEITESTLAGDMDYAIRVLGSLRAAGVRLALDDFGTGYSSLSYLRRFPIHTLKLDRSFLRDVPGDVQDARLVESIVRLAHDLGVSVTAEGIETREQWDFLRGCQCEEAQGYLWARPLPVAEVQSMLPRLGL